MAATGGTPRAGAAGGAGRRRGARQRRPPLVGVAARDRGRVGCWCRCCRRTRARGSARSRCRGCTWLGIAGVRAAQRAAGRGRPGVGSPPARTSSRCWPGGAATARPPCGRRSSASCCSAPASPARRTAPRPAASGEYFIAGSRDRGRARDDPAGAGRRWSGLARLSGRLPLTLRYAVRDAARHRTRTVPAVAAVAATVAGVVALGIATTSDEAQNEAGYTPSLTAGTGVGPGTGRATPRPARRILAAGDPGRDADRGPRAGGARRVASTGSR